MIRLTGEPPRITCDSAELVKINCTYDCYGSEALFWEQDGGQCFISMIDGNMVIYNRGAETDELSSFVGMLSPACVFSDLKTLGSIGLNVKEPVCVMTRTSDVKDAYISDTLSSREIYDMLDVDGLSLPEYEYFAVDFCRRLNHGLLDYFALRGKCAAISLHTGNFALMNGIASREKGYGTMALSALLSKNYGRSFLVCCREPLKGFYLKNGFREIYKSAYWVRKQ